MTSPVDARAADQQGLADAMKTHTWTLHGEAERTGTISDILNRRATLDSYVLLVRNFLPVYALLDSKFEQASAFPEMKPYLTPAMKRADALAHDLAALAGPNAQDDLPILQETHDYCGHIKSASAQGPAGLLGHIYVRYLGDLYGGQTLNRLLGSSLGIDANALTFYDFSGVSDLIAFRNGLRDAINTCSLNAQEFDQALAAAYAGFQSNVLVSKKVQALMPQVA